MKKNQSRSRGRPLSFNREEALDAAVQVFWKKGYEGASIGELTKAMGINPPSLYAAFENKQGLFLQAIDRYVETITSTQVAPLLGETDIKVAVSGYLHQVVRCAAAEHWPAGCLVVSVATEASERDDLVREKVSHLASKAEDFIAQRVELARASDPNLRVIDPRRFARLAVAAGQSLATRARGGASAAELHELADDFVTRLF